MYCCVLHYRRINAWTTSWEEHPVENFVVSFNSCINEDSFMCSDDGDILNITVTQTQIIFELLHMEFGIIHSEHLQYKKDIPCVYRVPATDVMESWEFIISDDEIDYEKIHPEFIKGADGVYYNIKDIEENKKRKQHYGLQIDDIF